jgi:hypothetical protein
MSDYTIKNLMDVADSAAGRAPGMQARMARTALESEQLGVKQWDVIRIAPPVVRGFEAGPDGLEVIAIGGSRPEEGDGELVSEWWTYD